VGRNPTIAAGEKVGVDQAAVRMPAHALCKEKARVRIGCGYDIHRLVEGRKLFLGGVEIPFAQGLLGHSDADVALHALADALLGAAGAGDIGIHFPDTDLRFKDISSVVLLRATYELIRGRGYEVHNVDLTIVAEKPKVAPFVSAMKEKISATLEIPESAVNIKATTNEHLGALGRAEGIAALAVALLHEKTGESLPTSS
jgi:2-C-methyl-D-erythritol 2,4-cyclodiphosphate synthase